MVRVASEKCVGKHLKPLAGSREECTSLHRGNRQGDDAIDSLGNTRAHRNLERRPRYSAPNWRRISAQPGSLAPRYHGLPPIYPIERTADVEHPDIIHRLQPISAAENLDCVPVKHRGVYSAWRGNVCSRERRAQPTARWDVKDVDVVVVSRALAAANDDLASYESREERAVRR